jgi:hypothetical protein
MACSISLTWQAVNASLNQVCENVGVCSSHTPISRTLVALWMLSKNGA